MQDYIEINIKDEIYPNKLKQIKNAPKKLYMRGNYSLLNKTGIAIVGSRECTSYGFKQSYEFGKELSKKDICIISGLAEGIDTASHLGGMHQIGNTIAVLGTGLNNIYPEENKLLAESIIKNNGLIITEYGLYGEVNSQNFPRRNRIMSGLADGILVIEAKNKSGTLITARLAKEQGKKLFCLPGNIDIKNSSGTNELIKSRAKIVTNIDDILEEIEVKITDKKDTPQINDEYKKVYDVITNSPININQICKKANVSIAEANQTLTMLEIEGVIKSLPNNEYMKE